MKPASMKFLPGRLRRAGSPSTSSFSEIAGILQLTSSQTIEMISIAMDTYQMGCQENAIAAPPAAS